jgi:uncharacterized protein YoxC
LTADLLAAPGAAAYTALLQAPALADTVVAVQAYTGLDRWANVAFSIATIVIAVALIVVAAALVAAALAARRVAARAQQMMERMRVDVDPVLKHAVSVSDNVDYITTSIRGDVQRLNDTVAQATRRLNRAARLAEERITDFNALLGVVQEEAESLFVSTAATVRGVQVGTEAFRRYRDPEGYDPYEDDPAELLEDDRAFDEVVYEDEEDDDAPPPRRGRGHAPRG